MEEDEDDFYGADDAENGNSAAVDGTNTGMNNEQMNEDEIRNNVDHDDDEEDDEDDDDDIVFTLEKPEGASSEVHRPLVQRNQSQEPVTTPEVRTVRKESQAVRSEETPGPDSATKSSNKAVLSYNGKEGKDFPEIRSSTIDVNADPIWPGNGKPITDIDIDADLAEHSKPWRITGTDQTDYFNYGFDEYTWTMYCLRQKEIRSQIDEQRATEQQMKAALGIGEKPGGMPAGMPPMGGANMMGGMPDMFNPEQMMQQMMAQGVNPANMDFGQFMQMAGQMGGGPGMPNGQPGYGSGQNSASPIPGPGQGFQPPSGPSAQQAMQNPSMEGYSQQQMAILQEQQGPAMGGGGRGRGRRNRGYY